VKRLIGAQQVVARLNGLLVWLAAVEEGQRAPAVAEQVDAIQHPSLAPDRRQGALTAHVPQDRAAPLATPLL